MKLEQILTAAFLVTWLSSAIRLATPTLLAALGETFDELAGICNVGIEGTMLLGGLTGFLVSLFLGSPWLGMLAAIGVGMLVNIFLAWMYIRVKANQIVVGLTFNTLCLGLASYANRAVLGIQTGPQKSPMFPAVRIPGLSDLPVVGPLLFSYTLPVYITVALVFVSGFVLYRTKFGLKLRATGEHPRAADTAGINVFRMRYAGVLLSGAASAMGGAFLVLSQLGVFRDNIVSGRGFIALAVVIFGRWNPYKAAVAALVFGAADALQLSLQIFSFHIPPQLMVSLPYLVTIVVMSGVIGKAIQPAALMTPYSKE